MKTRDEWLVTSRHGMQGGFAWKSTEGLARCGVNIERLINTKTEHYHHIPLITLTLTLTLTHNSVPVQVTYTFTMANDHILTLACPDKPGIIHAVTAIFAAHALNILELQQFSDPVSQRFFMRVHFGPTTTADTEHLAAPFAELAAQYAMEYDIRPVARKMRALIMVSKIGHCLNDLLFRVRTGQLQLEVYNSPVNKYRISEADQLDPPHRQQPP